MKIEPTLLFALGVAIRLLGVDCFAPASSGDSGTQLKFITTGGAGDPGNSATGAKCGLAVATPLVNAGDIATFTTLARHTLEAGQAVSVVVDDNPNLSDTALYNGAFEIISVPSANTFQFKLPGSATDAAAPNAVSYSLWRVGRFILERNIIDQILHPLKASPVQISTEGIYLNGEHTGTVTSPPILPPFIFPLPMIRRNVIQHVDQKVDSSPRIKRSAWLQSTGVGIVVNNIMSVHFNHLDTGAVNHIIRDLCGVIKMVGNQDEVGKALQIYNANTSAGEALQFKNDLVTDAQLAALSV